MATKVYYFPSIIDVICSNKLKDVDLVFTEGYYLPNDGGCGKYKISNDFTLLVDGGSVISLNNNLKAILIFEGEANIKQFGAREDFDDNTSYIQNAINYAKRIRIPSGIFLNVMTSIRN